MPGGVAGDALGGGGSGDGGGGGDGSGDGGGGSGGGGGGGEGEGTRGSLEGSSGLGGSSGNDSVSQGAQSGIPSRRRSYVAQSCVEKVQLESSDSEEKALHASRLKQVSSDEDDLENGADAQCDDASVKPPPKKVCREQVIKTHTLDVMDLSSSVPPSLPPAPPAPPASAVAPSEVAPVKVPQFSYVANMKAKDISVALRALGRTPRGKKKEMIKQLEEALRDPDDDHVMRKKASKADIEAGIQRLEDKGYKIFNVLDDGACFFRCLALHYDGDEEMHEKYRKEVTNKLHEYTEIIGTSLERGPHVSVDAAVTRLATRLRDSDEWVGEDGILASALALEVEIVVHNVNHAEPLRYNTPASLMQFNPTIEVFYDGEHYQYAKKRDEAKKSPMARWASEMYPRGPTSLGPGDEGDTKRFDLCERDSCGTDRVGCDLCAKFRKHHDDFDYATLKPCEICYQSNVKCEYCIFQIYEAFLIEQQEKMSGAAGLVPNGIAAEPAASGVRAREAAAIGAIMQDGSGSESESESSKRRKTNAAGQEGEGHSTDRLGGEHGEAAVTGSADDVASKPGMQRIYKLRGQSITGSRLSSEHRMIGMGLSKKR